MTCPDTQTHQQIHDHLAAAHTHMNAAMWWRTFRLHAKTAAACTKATIHLTIAVGLTTLENARLRQQLEAAGITAEEPTNAPEARKDNVVDLDHLANDLAANLGKTDRKDAPK